MITRRTSDFTQARSWIRAAQTLGLTAHVFATGDWRDREGEILFAGRGTECQIAPRGNALIYTVDGGMSRVSPLPGAELRIELVDKQ